MVIGVLEALNVKKRIKVSRGEAMREEMDWKTETATLEMGGENRGSRLIFK